MVIAAIAVPMWALLTSTSSSACEDAVDDLLGFGRREIFLIYVLQSLVVAVIGCAIGAALGYGLVRYFQGHPIFEWESLVVRPLLDAASFGVPVLVIIATAIAAASYPAWRAARDRSGPRAAEDRVIVEVDSVTRRFGERDVVADVALSIDDAESVALMGPSGCGKTTLLQMIGLLDRPNTGKIVLRGCDAWHEPDAIRAEMRLSWLGFVFQQNNLIPHLTARDNVALPAWRAGASRRDAGAQADTWLERFGLAARASARASELSIGEAQRVAVARALINKPSLILADEPTGSLDAEAGSAVIDLVFDLNRSFGTTLVMVTHEEHLAQRCARIVRLVAG
jgi:ABC-type lipoprotein export system ATPase subunit